MRIYDPFIGPPLDQTRLADRLDEATGQLRAELSAHREVDTEQEALWTSAA
jgi:hypothetical protein